MKPASYKKGKEEEKDAASESRAKRKGKKGRQEEGLSCRAASISLAWLELTGPSFTISLGFAGVHPIISPLRIFRFAPLYSRKGRKQYGRPYQLHYSSLFNYTTRHSFDLVRTNGKTSLRVEEKNSEAKANWGSKLREAETFLFLRRPSGFRGSLKDQSCE